MNTGDNYITIMKGLIGLIIQQILAYGWVDVLLARGT